MRRLPPLPAVRAFEAAARHGTFTSAAVELGMTQAAVSYQIKVLEERLGTALFNRRGRRVELTAAGARAASRLSVAFDEIGGAFDELRGEEEAVLRVTTTNTFASTWLARHIGSFQQAHPDLEIQLDATGDLVDLAAGEHDVAIRAGSGHWPGIDATRLCPVDFTPMCSPAFLKGRTTPLPASDALTFKWISPRDHWWRVWLAAAGIDDGADGPRLGARMDSQVSEGQAAIAGQGLAILTPILWATEITEGRLVQPFSCVADDGQAYWVASSAARSHLRKIARFRSWLLHSFATP